ncbi:hypothetical protein Nepgr_004189 [Nepenthes gracilis]|uniref:WAT1-related protein n=1 Tax=Nepenthes gracilis TaxID=150966 RepID=A0AAD3S0W2_NEPGR|nr:hypothetical protein Nepgr_004189 [Nepenthes gracilis]
MHWNIAGKRARRSINSPGRAMALEAFALGVSCRRFKPHLFMVLVQTASALLYFITEAAFNNGLNTHVYVTYRHIVGGIVVLPFAYFLERKVRPKLTFALFVEIFLLSLLGVGLTVNMYFASMRYTSPAFVSATINTIPSLTFILSVIFRLEDLDVRDSHGLAKVIGTAFSLIGAMSLTLYRGKEIRCPWNSPIHLTRSTFHKDWIKGSVLCVASCIAWSIWFTAQGFLLKRYPAQLSLTAWVNFVGAAQSAVFTAIAIRREPGAWSCTSLIDLGAIFFAGILSSGLNTSMLIWCTKEKGPVFVTMFCPLQTLLVVVFAYFILSERLYMGSFVGGVTIIMGLYLLLWGKGGDQELCIKSQEPSHSSCDYQNESKMKIVTAPDKDGPQSTLNKL